MLAWHIDSSDIVAFIFRVRSLNLLWNSLIFSETSRVDCLPSIASFFNFSDKLVTSSRISSFSRSCYFLLFNLSYKILIFASKASSSGSYPPNYLHLSLFSGSSNLFDKSLDLEWVYWICLWSSNNWSANLGTELNFYCETLIFLANSFISIFIIRISSYKFLTATSDFLKMFSWIFDFS